MLRCYGTRPKVKWDSGDLQDLKRESAIIGQAEFSQLVASKIPPGLQRSLLSGIEDQEPLNPPQR